MTDNNYAESEDEQVLLSITTDCNLTFESHINSIYKKASQELMFLQVSLTRWTCRNEEQS